jgi:ribosomal protein L37E
MKMITYDERPIKCPNCGYSYPSVIFCAKGNPNPFEILIECEKCGYKSKKGETIEDCTSCGVLENK